MLRAPLRAGDGTLRAHPGDIPPGLRALCAGDPSLDARLALYREQGWRRLFHAVHDAWPRTTGILGPWGCNRAALAWFTAHPPRGHDLGRIADGFGAALPGLLDPLAAPLPPGPLRDAIALDDAVRRAWHSPWTAPEALPDVTALSAVRVGRAPGLSAQRVHWDVRSPPHDLGEDRWSPPRLHPPGWVVVARTSDGVGLHPVDPLTGWLLTVRRPAPIADHVARVLRACEPALRQTATADLPDRLEALFAQGWWQVAAEGSTNA